MYKIADKWLGHIMKYSMKTKLDLRGTYTKEEWNKAGFKDTILVRRT